MPTFAEALAKDGEERAFQLANRVLTGVLLVHVAADACWASCSPSRIDATCLAGTAFRRRGGGGSC